MISFFSEETPFCLKQRNLRKAWLKQIAHNHDYEIQNLTYIFCSDDYLLNINRQYLGHDYYTDIITFNNGESAMMVDGDAFISIDTVTANGKDYGEGFEQELTRVMAHGLLHLVGFNDLTVEQQAEMRIQENLAIELWKSLTTSL